NPGFDARVRWIDFEDYADDELMDIAGMMMGDAQECLGDGAEQAIRALLAAHRQTCRMSNSSFGNGREVQNLLVATRRAPALRLDALGRPPTDNEWTTLLAEDVWAAAYPAVSPRGAAENEPAEEEL